jgi:hypothetical protein
LRHAEPCTGLTTVLATLDHARLTTGAQALGIAQSAIGAPAYVTQRRQFGRSPSTTLADPPVKLPSDRDQIATKELPELVRLRTEVSRLVRSHDESVAD